jgi:hypothetical protein
VPDYIKLHRSKGSYTTTWLARADESYTDFVAFIKLANHMQGPDLTKGYDKAELIALRDWINGRLQELEPVNLDEEVF